MTRRPRRSTRRSDGGGFALLDLLIGAGVLGIALLLHASAVFRTHTLNQAEEERGGALIVLQGLVERLRADPDFAGLYGRLKTTTSESPGDTALRSLRVDRSLAMVPLTTYYSDLVVPRELGTVTALVQVPAVYAAGVATLRENLVAPRYGLPADLNGDGVVDGNVRDGDYVVLPVVARVRWFRPGRDADEIVISTLLRKP